MIIAGCTGLGLTLANANRKLEQSLLKLIQIIQYIERELESKLMPLPELCRQVGREVCGSIGTVFLDLAREMDWNAAPDVSGCMKESLRKGYDIPPAIRTYLIQLGHDLGQYELPLQLEGLRGIRERCQGDLHTLRQDREQRLRNYRTFGICSGAALVVLLV